MRNAAHRYGFSVFWRWWLDQLMPLIPAGPRNAMRRRRLWPILAFQSDAAVLFVPHVTDGTLAFAEAARIPASDDPSVVAKAGRAAIDALPRGPYGANMTPGKVVVALPVGQVLRKTILLPAAAEENLRQVLAYDLDRLTPFKADEVYFDAVVVGRDLTGKEIRVDWVAALKTAVDQARRRAESWGAAVVGVIPEPPTGVAALEGTKLNLLPDGDRREASTRRRWELWIPVGLVVAVAFVATALPLWQKRGYAIALAQVAEQQRVRAEASNALREQLDQLTGEYNYALQKKYAFPSAVQVVEDITKLLPDDTWLTQFEMKSQAKGKEMHREILVRGESVNAGRLVSLLEDSKLFEQAAPRSPTTKIQPGPGEIFDLGAQLRALPAPPSAALASAAPVAIAPPASDSMPASGAASAPPVPASGAASTPPALNVAPATSAAKGSP